MGYVSYINSDDNNMIKSPKPFFSINFLYKIFFLKYKNF